MVLYHCKIGNDKRSWILSAIWKETLILTGIHCFLIDNKFPEKFLKPGWHENDTIFITKKEFKQIFRNKSILAMVVVMPIVQLLILPLAANYEVKNINLTIIDNDHSSWSQKLITTITASSGYFKLSGYNNSYKDAMQLVEADKADLVFRDTSKFLKRILFVKMNKNFCCGECDQWNKSKFGWFLSCYYHKELQQ